jgi:hypothetical protein
MIQTIKASNNRKGTAFTVPFFHSYKYVSTYSCFVSDKKNKNPVKHL